MLQIMLDSQSNSTLIVIFFLYYNSYNSELYLLSEKIIYMVINHKVKLAMRSHYFVL